MVFIIEKIQVVAYNIF